MTRITVQYGVELQFRDGLGWIGSGRVDFSIFWWLGSNISKVQYLGTDNIIITDFRFSDSSDSIIT